MIYKLKAIARVYNLINILKPNSHLCPTKLRIWSPTSNRNLMMSLKITSSTQVGLKLQIKPTAMPKNPTTHKQNKIAIT